MIIQSVSKEQLQKMVPKWFMLLFPLALLVEYASIQWFPTIFFVSSKLFIMFALTLEHLLLCYFVQMDIRIQLPKAFCQGAQSCHVIDKIPWSRKWQPTPVFLPGKSYGFPMDRGAWLTVAHGVAELDMTELLKTIIECLPADELGVQSLQQ